MINQSVSQPMDIEGLFHPMDIEELFQRLEETKQMLLGLKQLWASSYADYCAVQKDLIDMDIRIGILAVYNAKNVLSTWEQRHQEELRIQAEQNAWREKQKQEWAELKSIQAEMEELDKSGEWLSDSVKRNRYLELTAKLDKRGYYYLSLPSGSILRQRFSI